MNKRIAILRGINVGGKRKILMADLKEMFKQLNYTNVVTYIQSGNVIFSTESDISNLEIESQLEAAITEKFGFDVPVIVRTEDELDQIIETNPYKEDAEIEQLHLTFLKTKPRKENLEKIENIDIKLDQFNIKGSNAYICISGNYRDTKLTNKFFESKLKTSATNRNWKTVSKLAELIKNH